MDNYIVCSNITKRFNKKNDNYALNNVNISINKGEFCCFGWRKWFRKKYSYENNDRSFNTG